MAMVLPFGKLTILIGAGLVGSVFAKEGSLPDVSSLVSGAFKMVFRQLKQEEPAQSASKPRNDILVAQVNSLRNELQLLASNRPMTIVTTAGPGRKYGLIIIVGVIGYGYVRWKGWKLPDFMFATRRSLSDACNNVGSQIDGFYSSLSASSHCSFTIFRVLITELYSLSVVMGTKRELSSKIDGMDLIVDENSVIIKETGRQVDELRDGTANIKGDVRSVFDAVETLADKVFRIEKNQALPSTSTMLAIEAAPATPASRDTLCSPPASPRESQSPSSIPNGAQKSHGPLQHTQSMSGLKDISESSSSRETFSNGVDTVGKATGNGASGGSSAGLLGGFSLTRIVRTLSAVNTVPTN
ncbi:unnamed protein product [Thlaspi arvense]|uniref:DUF1664 domain-containing protein n=1 Tax=Thlaspi arvense TaxID=13288 RepID=A0AAU9R5T1_THLAR|nr:unnamed protein product [Thlaspi arvense]